MNKMNKNIEIVKIGGKLTYKTLIRGEKNNRTGKWLRKRLIELGPTYVKLGQTISTRSDIFPTYITSELRKLQDNVAEISYNDIINVIEDEIECDINDIFSWISTKPIANASISQVHKAKLKKNNKLVVVKVQRPNLKNMYEEDLRQLKILTSFLSLLNMKQINDIMLIINETSQNVETELNFYNEKENMLTFQKLYENNDEILIPRVYTKHTTRRMLIMEYMPGEKIDTLDDTNSKELSEKLMSNFVNVLMKYGMVHGDPHAGNLSIIDGNKIVIYDYGIIVKLDVDLQITFQKMLTEYLKRDVMGVMKLILENEIIYSTESKSKKIEGLNPNEYVVLYKLIGYIFEYVNTLNIEQLSSSIANDRDIDMQNIPFILNSKMITLFNSMTKLEGVCKSLNPDFKYTDILLQYIDNEFIMNRIMSDMSQLTSMMTNKQNNMIQETKIIKIEEKLEKYMLIMLSMLTIIIFKIGVCLDMGF